MTGRDLPVGRHVPASATQAARHGAAEHADTVAVLNAEIKDLEARVAGLMRSRSWRLMKPLRSAAEVTRTLKASASPRQFVRRLLTTRSPGLRPKPLAEYAEPASQDAGRLLSQRILIVAELSIDQCAKYRVWQKLRYLGELGTPCTVLAWFHHDAIRQALQTHSLVIFYRVPAYDATLANIAEARRLRIPTFWEVDDLIFDPVAYAENPNLGLLEPTLRQTVLDGVPLFRKALLACDHGIASTETLASAMRAAGKESVFVIENGIDDETLSYASAAVRASDPRHPPTIVYGSGSKAHGADFALAADAIADVLRLRPSARFRLIGDLELPAAFDDVLGQVDRLPPAAYEAYLRLLAGADVNIAPVTAGAFNDAKSNIKWIEAALVGLPSVCSPRTEFDRVIKHGENGFLAVTRQDWFDCLLRLVDDNSLRETVAAAARDAAENRYRQSASCARGIGALAARFASTVDDATRVLVVNTFFAPQSFGGATVIAEQMASILDARPDLRVAAFTSWGDPEAEPYALNRFEVAGMPVFAARMPDDVTPTLAYHNIRMIDVFATVLDAWRPDVVHLHSVQGLGAAIARACIDRSIPYVVTLHDAWWICERQFMVRPEGRYCFQTRIDFAVCATCVPDLGFSVRRFDKLHAWLSDAALLIAPSAFHRELHLANGFSPERVALNKNGVRVPGEVSRTPSLSGRLRFGFVGGVGALKGFDQIRAAMEGIARSDWELLIVDNTLNLGFSSIEVADWAVSGEVRVVPAYTQATIDEFFAGLDVLLFPSQWKESFGLTVREALVRDVWVLATDAGGAAEDIVDGVNGTVIPMSPDPVPLRAAIEDLLGRPDRLAGYVNPLRDRITTTGQQAEQLADMLHRAVADSRLLPNHRELDAAAD